MTRTTMMVSTPNGRYKHRVWASSAELEVRVDVAAANNSFSKYLDVMARANHSSIVAYADCDFDLAIHSASLPIYQTLKAAGQQFSHVEEQVYAAEAAITQDDIFSGLWGDVS